MSDIELAFMEQFGCVLDAAAEGNYLPNPTLATDNQNKTDSTAYIRALRARLIELGYLAEGKGSNNRTKGQPDLILIKKIKRLQGEAGIKKDGWAGNKTWQVLECLMSFENQQSPSQWQQVWNCPNNLVSNPVVLRAVYCRLFSMGFFADWDRINTKTVISPADNMAFHRAILRFCKFAQSLRLISSDCNSLNAELLTALFEYDQLLNRICDPNRFNLVKHEFRQNLDAITRIELWLLGYDVQPGEEQVKTVYVGPRERRIRKKKQKTPLAIKKFCKDHRLWTADENSITDVSVELMQAFTQISPGVPESGQDAKSVNNSVNLILENQNSRNTFKNQFQQLANGIFDGIKRAARWLFNVIKRVVKFSREFITNIVRYISNSARKYYLGVVKAFDIVYSGMTYLKQDAFHYTKPTKLFFGHDNDFDQFCIIAPDTTPQHIQIDTCHNRLRIKLYSAGLTILGHLMKMMHRVIRSLSSPMGWLLALLSLSNLAHSIKAITHQIKLVEQYELDVDHQQALFKTRIS